MRKKQVLDKYNYRINFNYINIKISANLRVIQFTLQKNALFFDKNAYYPHKANTRQKEINISVSSKT